MSQFKGIVKVTKKQLEDLEKNGSIVIEGVTHIYEPYNILYITDEPDEDTVKSVAGKVGDVILNIADINGLSDSISTIYNNIENTTTTINNKIEEKIDKNPNGVTPLVNNNNKINLTYIPDSILGQLVYGGTAGMYDLTGVIEEAGDNAKYFGLSLTSDAQEKLNTTETYIKIYESTDATPYEGLYFVIESVKISKLTLWGITFQVGDWLVATQDGWKKIDNTDAVQSVAGKTGAVTLTVSDINGLGDELDTKVPFIKVPNSTSIVNTFSDGKNNVGLALVDADATKSGYIFKAYNDPTINSLQNFYIQYYQGASTGIYETVLGVEKNSTYNEMQVYCKPAREEATCELNPEYTDGGSVRYYRNNDMCAINLYVNVKNCVSEWSDNEAIPHGYHIATLPAGINTFGSYYGTVVTQADGRPCPGQTYLVKIVDNKVYLVTKGYALESSWVIGSAFFFKLPSQI